MEKRMAKSSLKEALDRGSSLPFLFRTLCGGSRTCYEPSGESWEDYSYEMNRKWPSIQHLLFAEDRFFLCRTNLSQYAEVLRCLKLYGNSLGQVIRFQKSAVTFGMDIDPVMKRLIVDILSIENEGDDGKYLGLPECFSGSKQKLLAFIGEKLQKRLKGWFAKKLSLEERRCSLNPLRWLYQFMLCHAFG